MTTVLIVDDEPPARRRVRALLAGRRGYRVVGECGTGREAVEAIRAQTPDLVFLDVQMPELGGLEVVAELGEQMPVVVFVTAYDEFALRAFDAHAIDYLLKPFDEERFCRALERAAVHLRGTRRRGEERRLHDLVRAIGTARPPLERLAVRTGTRTRLLEVDEVDYLEAEENYVRLHVGERAYLLRETLGRLEARLDPQRFLRVHRSVIVNLSRIRELESLFAGEYVLFLHSGARLTTGRTYRVRIQEALGLRG